MGCSAASAGRGSKAGMVAGHRKKVWDGKFSAVRCQMRVVVCLHLLKAAEQIHCYLQTEVNKHMFRQLQVILNQHLDLGRSLPSIFCLVLAQPATAHRGENKQTNISQLRTTKGEFTLDSSVNKRKSKRF